jgi:hypothetical protein
MANTNTRKPVSVQAPAAQAAAVADFMGRSRLDGDDLIFTVDRKFPGLSFRIFAAALALYRARRGDPGFAFVFPAGGGVQ